MLDSFLDDLFNLAIDKDITVFDAFTTFGESLLEDNDDLTEQEIENFLASVKTRDLEDLEQQRKDQIYESRHKLECIGMKESDFM